MRVEPHGDAPLKSGVADSGGPSFIGCARVPNGCAINESPVQPKFQRVGKKTTGVLGYITTPVYLPNAAVLSGDERSVGIIKIDVEFHVVEHLACRYLLGRDALKAHKAIIDEGCRTDYLSSLRSTVPRSYH